jgi:AraC-like DNA-binding protein
LVGLFYYYRGFKVNSVYYYAFDDKIPARQINTCSSASNEHPFIVNCAGNISTAIPFVTDNRCGREDYYLIFMVSGTMNASFPSGDRGVQEGDVLLFPPHYPYRYVYAGGERLSYLWVHFTGSYVERFLSDCGLDPLPLLCNTESGERILAGFHRMFDLFNTHARLQTQLLAHTLESILLTVANTNHVTDTQSKLQNSIRYIHANYNKKISVPSLAKMEGLCNSRYITLFEQSTGYSPIAFIIKLRLDTACELLRNTDISVKQIGSMVGYSDAHFFSRIFKKETGMSPQAYRIRKI